MKNIEPISHHDVETLNQVLTHKDVAYLFIGKGAAVLHGFPDTTQDVDIFPRNDTKNTVALIEALTDLGFTIDSTTADEITRGKDFVQLRSGPFDVDLVCSRRTASRASTTHGGAGFESRSFRCAHWTTSSKANARQDEQRTGKPCPGSKRSGRGQRCTGARRRNRSADNPGHKPRPGKTRTSAGVDGKNSSSQRYKPQLFHSASTPHTANFSDATTDRKLEEAWLATEREERWGLAVEAMRTASTKAGVLMPINPVYRYVQLPKSRSTNPLPYDELGSGYLPFTTGE